MFLKGFLTGRKGDFYILGYIHCCGGKRKSESYAISPRENFLSAQMDYLEECPVCGHTVVQITSVDFDNNVSICRKTNKKAKILFEKLKPLILFKGKRFSEPQNSGSKFYLYYNEYGKKKKCYSNLSTLKLGKFDNFGDCKIF